MGINRTITASVLLLASVVCLAQKRVSADVQVKSVAAGKVSTINKSVCCESNGRLVVHFTSPAEYYILTNTLGETKMYIPKTNEVLTDSGNITSSGDELLYIFITGKADDLGLREYGYRQTSAQRDGKYIVKTFCSDISGQTPRIDIAYENYLPVYCAYYQKSDKPVTKTYLSDYKMFARLLLPCRATSVTYTSAKDSSVVRTIYSNVRVDGQDPDFLFEVPGDAKAVAMPSAK